MEAVMTGDWHLLGMEKHFPDSLARQFHEIDKMCNYAIENGISNIIVAGDVSDTPHMPEEAYIALLTHLHKYDGVLNTYYIAGNHDFADVTKTSMNMLAVLVEFGLFKTFTLALQEHKTYIDGIAVNLLPYPCLVAPKRKWPALNISHVEYNGAVGDNGRSLRTKQVFVQNEGDYNVSGHIHQYQSIPSKRALYTGNPYQKNFGESLPKGFVHLKAKYVGKGSGRELRIGQKFIDGKPDFQFINQIISSSRDFSKLTSSDHIRYKLWIAEGVQVPKNLLTEFPNITGGLFDLGTKTRQDKEEDRIIRTTATVDTRQRLIKHLKTKRHDKDFIKLALKETRKAADQLGITL